MRGILGIVAAAVLNAAAAQAGIDPAKAVLFPVVIEAATLTGGDALKPQDVFYEQTLRSAKAVRLKSDLHLTYKTHSRFWGSLAPASDNPLTVKAGQLFVVAQRAQIEIYCTTVSDRTGDTLGRVYEIAVCLKDGDKDGVFDAALNFESYPYRARVPYEIGAFWRDDWQAVSAGYEALAPAEIPAVRLTFRYRLHTVESAILSALGVRTAHLETAICWPEALLAQTAGRNGICGTMDWFALKDEIPTDAKAKGTLSASGMTVDYERNPDGTLRARVPVPLAAGPAMLSTGMWLVLGTELREGILTVKLTPDAGRQP
jgi:hypothetical protein